MYKRLYNKLVDIKIRALNNEAVYSSGYLVEESLSLIGILRFYDFFLDGYAIFKKKRLLSVQNRPINRHQERLMHAEKIRDKTRLLPMVDISTEDHFLNAIKEHRYPLAAYSPSSDGKSCLTLGYLTEIRTEVLSMRSISTQGILSSRNVVLQKEDIFGYLYGDRYTTLYGKYAREANKINRS